MSSHIHISGPISNTYTIMPKSDNKNIILSCQVTHVDPSHDNTFGAYRSGYGVEGNGNTWRPFLPKLLLILVLGPKSKPNSLCWKWNGECRNWTLSKPKPKPRPMKSNPYLVHLSSRVLPLIMEALSHVPRKNQNNRNWIALLLPRTMSLQRLEFKPQLFVCYCCSSQNLLPVAFNLGHSYTLHLSRFIEPEHHEINAPSCNEAYKRGSS